MPRQPRPDLAGVPQHVVQRGNDRQACFFEEIAKRGSECTFLTYLLDRSEQAGKRGGGI